VDPSPKPLGGDERPASSQPKDQPAREPGRMKLFLHQLTRKIMEKVKALAEKTAAIEGNPAAGKHCVLCGKPATQFVDGEPSCALHVEQVYEHQVEDYTRTHLADHESREV
jgi:uncharacterized Zn finger protein (UPF0148 family)